MCNVTSREFEELEHVLASIELRQESKKNVSNKYGVPMYDVEHLFARAIDLGKKGNYVHSCIEESTKGNLHNFAIAFYEQTKHAEERVFEYYRSNFRLY